MKRTEPLSNAFRRCVTYLPAARIVLNSQESSMEADSFCALSYHPPIIALTLPKSGPELAGSEFRVVAGTAVNLSCSLLETKELGDHNVLFAAVTGVEILGQYPKVRWRGAWFDLKLDYPFLETQEALETFVDGWRTGVLPKERWTHAAHVAVTGYYAFDNDCEAVFAEMKRGILHFNASTGVANGPDSGYHETLTRFWSNRITLAVHDAAPESRLNAARAAVRQFGEDRDLPNLFYSFNVVRDRSARAGWVAPDLEPLPEWCGAA